MGCEMSEEAPNRGDPFRCSLRLGLLAGLAFSACAEFEGVELLRGPSRQHVVVVTEGGTTGTLHRMAKTETGWVAQGGPFRVVVGANGLAKQREGDKRAPTGAYSLTKAFGYAAKRADWLRLDYVPLERETECVDDATSSHYNRIVNPSELAGGRDWSSSEHMRRDLHEGDDLYKYGLVVDYNPDAARDEESGKGAGSCIFLHIWRGPESSTSGCTAMAEDDMIDLLRWLDGSASPILVQGTRGDLRSLEQQEVLPYSVPRAGSTAAPGG
jgi:L,D-peptidoglycan transpeptidase YkuD (ErfK/YbiS/YcfS/YnhG family)